MRVIPGADSEYFRVVGDQFLINQPLWRNLAQPRVYTVSVAVLFSFFHGVMDQKFDPKNLIQSNDKKSNE